MNNLRFLIVLSILFNCSVPSVMITHYIPGDDINNKKYFSEVHSHFVEIGQVLSSDEELKYTATTFIATIPPVCDIYVDSVFIGKSNISLLYFMPGENEVKFIKGNIITRKTIFFNEGKNKSLMIKLN